MKAVDRNRVAMLDVLALMQQGRRPFVVYRYWLPFGGVTSFEWEDGTKADLRGMAHGGKRGYLTIGPQVRSGSGPVERREIQATEEGWKFLEAHRPGGHVPDYVI